MTPSTVFFSRVAGAALAGMLLAGGAHANSIVNGDFENQPNFGANGDGSYTLLTSTQLPGWTIAPNRGVTIHNHGYPFISGTYSVNMDGEGLNSHNADFSQDFASSAGTAYDFSFDWSVWSANGTAMLGVTITDTVSSSVLYSGNFPGTSAAGSHEMAQFLGTGNALRLRVFESTESGFNDNTFIVDNFSVTAVPEPESLAMMLAGLVVVGSVVRRRSAART